MINEGNKTKATKCDNPFGSWQSSVLCILLEKKIMIFLFFSDDDSQIGKSLGKSLECAIS